MKTIEITSGTQKVQFTTKSVTFDGKEFFYANMGDVTNDAIKCIYTFVYDGEIKSLPYEQKDAKVLNAIFSQVQNLKSTKETADSVPSAEEKTVGGQVPENQGVEEQPADADTKAHASDAAQGTEEQADTQEKPAENVEQADAKTESAEKAQQTEAKTESAEKTQQTEAKEETAEKTEKPETAEKDDKPADPEKQARFKKSMKIFGIVLGAVIVVSLIYYFVFHTAEDPALSNPNTTESQQYEDIDQLIEDLQ